MLEIGPEPQHDLGDDEQGECEVDQRVEKGEQQWQALLAG